jgi:hypothetical protein
MSPVAFANVNQNRELDEPRLGQAVHTSLKTVLPG